jgi:hypothetical protein
MLKTSPIIDSLPNASPTFRYATSTVSSHASPRQPTALRGASFSRPIDRQASSLADGPAKPLASHRSMTPPCSAGSVAAAQSLSDPPIHNASSSSASFAGHCPNGNIAEPSLQPNPRRTIVSNTASVPNQQTPAGHVSAESNVADQPSAVSPNKRRGSPTAIGAASITQTQLGKESGDLASKKSRHDERPAKLLPHRYELCSVDDIVELIAHMIGELITTNDAIRVANGGLTRFHSR